MLDFHIHRRILSVLEDMQENLSSHTHAKERRSPEEYLQAIKEIGAVLDTLSTARQKCYAGLLAEPKATLEKAIRKGQPLGKKPRETCQSSLAKLHEELKAEKEVKKGIVFLPYQAAMWDSMESVWQAAERDKEHTNAYVIPIPYCHRNPDGTAASWHLDADKFPQNVPLLPWDKIDLYKWHPDIIVIHNGYENFSLPSCVEEHYFPSVLKDCTEKLVYIPYFFYRDKDAANPRFTRIRETAHCAALYHGDVTILNSRAEKEAYIRELADWHEEAYWRQRIFALGSPKVDKIRHLAREEGDLPEAWRKIIGDKKVVLYNTSVAEPYIHTDSYLEKISDTLAYFKSREDAVLWWRPHPLLAATLHSIHEELALEYERIVSAYQKEGWGIYDDTGDMYRAIAWSDALYGDNSSVAVLYGMTGKPVLVQNYNVSNTQRGENI